jgi:hypothetical protein
MDLGLGTSLKSHPFLFHSKKKIKFLTTAQPLYAKPSQAPPKENSKKGRRGNRTLISGNFDGDQNPT